MATPSLPLRDIATSLSPRDDDEGLFSRDENGNLIRQDDPSEDDYQKKISLKIDGHPVEVFKARPMTDANGNIIRDINDRTTPRYTTIFDASAQCFVDEKGDETLNPIPVLCHQSHMTPVAVCRLCTVQVCKEKRDRKTGELKLTRERKLFPACQYPVEDGMEVFTMNGPPSESGRDDSDLVRQTVKTLTELLASNHLKDAALTPELSAYNELGLMSQRAGADPARFRDKLLTDAPPEAKPLAGSRGLDKSSPVFEVDHSACILCDRCVRACGEVKNNNIIGRTGKGATAGIGFDLNDPMGDSGCVQCGECMVSCPTTAISFKPFAQVNVAKLGSSSEVLNAADLLKEPMFKGIPPKFLFWQQGLVVRHEFQPGETISRQGEPGNTAFLIKSGRLEVKGYPSSSNRSMLGHHTPDFKAKPLLQVELTPENLMFGEMSCLSGLPRSGNVTALVKSEVWELRRNVLDRLMRLPSQRSRIEREYRRHAMELTLRSSGLFKDIPKPEYDKIIAYLRERISFVRVTPGQTICRQDDRASDFFIIRMGYVRVNVARFGNQAARVISRGPGTTLGEVSLLGLTAGDVGRSEEETDRKLQQLFEKAGDDIMRAIPAGFVTATVTALDYVEMARLNRADFMEMVRLFPVIRQRLIAQTLSRLREDDNPNALIEEYVNQGLYEARSVLVLDLDRCTRCDECTRGCIQRHGDESHGVPMARMMRDGMRFGQYLVATSCRSCETPHCMTGCPVDAIHRGKHLQIVIEDHCIGCGLCANNCPYGSISIQPNFHAMIEDKPRPKAVNCDLCDSKDQRSTPNPSCVASCPHDAAFRFTGNELLQMVMDSAREK